VDEFPSSVLATLPVEAHPAVMRWWSALAPADQDELVSRWDERREAYLFTPQSDTTGKLDSWKQIPTVIGGRFIPHDDSVRLHEWLEDWHEYLLGHEEVFLLPRVVVVVRTFHICQAEPAARAVLASGRLPADFACPAQRSGCLLQRIQMNAAGQALYLTPASAGWWVVIPSPTKPAHSSKTRWPFAY
jgi:hypothetical protein